MPEDMSGVDAIFSAYESRMESIGSIFDTTYQLVECLQDSFLDAKQERTKIHSQIRDILARNEHLRKRDFDNMMQGILLTQEEREKEVRSLLKGYLNEQKEMAQALRERLANSRDAIARGESQRVEEFQVFIKIILREQEKRKEEVISRLKEFQREQQEMARRLRELLDKGKDLRIKDLKSMFKEFRLLQGRRLTRRKERQKNICRMLDVFKKERVEAAKPRDAMQTAADCGRSALPQASD